MTRSPRTRALRWAVPAAAVAAVGLAASGALSLSAGAADPLPPRTAAQLLVDLQNAHVDGLSGTVVQNAKLGLPSLPDLGGMSSSSGTSVTSLLTGSHTLRVWYGGQTQSRVALLGSLGESDLIRNGQDVWLWSSDQKTATHYRLPAEATKHGTDAKGRAKPGTPLTPSGVPSPLTPQEAANRALAAIDPTTTVTTDGTGTVAGRSVYELVLAPKGTGSLIGQIRLAVDAKTGVPLRVEVFGRVTGNGPALEVGFTRVSFDRPAARQFQFTAPSGATVKEGSVPSGQQRSDAANRRTEASQDVTTVGQGWTTVAVIRNVSLPGTAAGGTAPKAGADAAPGRTTPTDPKADRPRDRQSSADQLAGVLDRLPRVSGSWGSGRLLTSTLVNAIFTDDGRVVVGAVSPDLLYRAAGTK